MAIFPQSQTFVAFKKQKVVGWAFALPYKGQVHLSLFVMEEYRRDGVATCLVEEALKQFSLIYLSEWNKSTHDIFNNWRERYGRISVFNWWKELPYFDRLLKAESIKGATW